MSTELQEKSSPFSRTASSSQVEIESQRAVAEVQSAMILARRFPRDHVAALDRILNACTRPSLAEGALYTYSRGGTDISGPSIRLAETIAQNWGNIQFGVRELEQREGESVVEAFAWDLETNTRQVKVFQVRHERHTDQGVKMLTKPRDIYELVANHGARRLRACILGVVPGDIVEEAVKQCEVTLQSSAESNPEKVKALIAAFGAMRITSTQIEKRIQRRIDSIQPAQIVQLRKIYASMRDGMSKPEDWFEYEPEFETASPTTTATIDTPTSSRRRGRPPKTVDVPIDDIAPVPVETAPVESLASRIDKLSADGKVTSGDVLAYLQTVGKAHGAWNTLDLSNDDARFVLDNWPHVLPPAHSTEKTSAYLEGEALP